MQEPKKQILAISGSTKSHSTSLSILRFVKDAYADSLDINIYNRIDALPHFNPELEEDLPEAVAELRQLIDDADGVLFCTPEYVFSLPGSLKNLIEWNVSTVLFSAKPVAMIVAAASGKKAFESLSLIMRTIEATLPDENRLLIRAAKGRLDQKGKITDPGLLAELDGLISSFRATIDDEQRTPTKYEPLP